MKKISLLLFILLVIMSGSTSKPFSFAGDPSPNGSSLEFDSLVQFHKQQAAEELTYLTIIFTVVLGIFAFIGSAARVEKLSRVFIVFAFTLFLLNFTLALLGSVRIHNGLHLEIEQHVTRNPNLFIDGEKSALYQALADLGRTEKYEVVVGSIMLWLFVVLPVLMMGEGKVFALKRGKN